MNGKIWAFALGLVAGAGLVLGSQRYHVVQAADGWHLVPKASAGFSDTYVDIRGFTLTDWDSHRGLAVSLVQSDKGYLMQDSASESLRQSVQSVVDTLSGRRS